jgi:hypothetical protein
MIQKTSIETYHAIKNSGLISEKRLKVFDIFYQNPQGLTGAEVSEIYRKENPTSQHSETIRNRIKADGGRYWAGTVVTEPRCFIFDNSNNQAGMSTNNRARALAVRCIKD